MQLQDYTKLVSYRVFNKIPREKLMDYFAEFRKKAESVSVAFIDVSEFCLWPEEILAALDRLVQEQIKK